MRKQHVSHRGRVLDFDHMIREQGDRIATGNANLNARGDRIGPKGEIVKTAEELRQEYFRNQARAEASAGTKMSISDSVQDLEKAVDAEANVNPKTENFRKGVESAPRPQDLAKGQTQKPVKPAAQDKRKIVDEDSPDTKEEVDNEQ